MAVSVSRVTSGVTNPVPGETVNTFVQRLRDVVPLLQGAASEADATASVAQETWALLRRVGVLRAPLSTAEGGVDLVAPGQFAALFDTLTVLGHTDLSLARLLEGHINAVALVTRYGDASQIAELAAAVRDGALSAVWGADGARPLRAEPSGAGLRLQGDKVLASGAGLVARPLVTAASVDGPVLLMLRLAPGERADVTGWTAQGMRSTATGTVDLDGVTVGSDQIIGRPGDFNRQPTLSGGAWRFCAAHLGATERLVDLFRAHLLDRKRDGDPYQLQRVATCAAAAGTARFWVRAAAERFATADDHAADDIVAFVNMTRFVTERTALDVVEAVQRGVGLGGFVRPHPIERITRDLTTYLRQPVPDLAMADAARRVLACDRPTAALWLDP